MAEGSACLLRGLAGEPDELDQGMSSSSSSTVDYPQSTMSVDQAPPKQAEGSDAAEDFKPSVAVLALADLLVGLPKALPAADDAPALRSAFALVRQAQDALRGASLFILQPRCALRKVADGRASLAAESGTARPDATAAAQAAGTDRARAAAARRDDALFKLARPRLAPTALHGRRKQRRRDALSGLFLT